MDRHLRLFLISLFPLLFVFAASASFTSSLYFLYFVSLLPLLPLLLLLYLFASFTSSLCFLCFVLCSFPSTLPLLSDGSILEKSNISTVSAC